MAQKRMFAKSIIDTDRFMDLPMSSKALYFLLGMEADDEGFVSYKKVIRIHGGNDDDIKVLITKNFLIVFPTGVVVITDWQKNNYLDKNRIKETEYQNEKKHLSIENDKYQLNKGVKQMFNKCLTSIEESSIEEYRVEENITATSVAENKEIVGILISFKDDINPTINFGNKTQRKACFDLIKQFGYEKIINTINYYKTVKDDKYCPVITTPFQLKEKMAQLMTYYKKQTNSLTPIL